MAAYRVAEMMNAKTNDKANKSRGGKDRANNKRQTNSTTPARVSWMTLSGREYLEVSIFNSSEYLELSIYQVKNEVVLSGSSVSGF